MPEQRIQYDAEETTKLLKRTLEREVDGFDPSRDEIVFDVGSATSPRWAPGCTSPPMFQGFEIIIRRDRAEI